MSGIEVEVGTVRIVVQSDIWAGSYGRSIVGNLRNAVGQICRAMNTDDALLLLAQIEDGGSE